MKLEPFKLERFFAKYEFNAPYLLCSSDCESVTVADLLAFEPEATEGLHNLWLGYTESAGSPQLRREITGLYERIEPEQILVHAGAEEAIFGFVNSCLETGDHVIVHFPCYQSLSEVARAAGCEVTYWEAHEADGWELDLDELKRNIKSNTRAIIVNCPHNPTGYLMSRQKQAQLVEIAREHNLMLFSDEVYRFLEHDEADRLPAAADLYENAVSLGVMSKTFGLAGLRIGWIATRNAEIYRKMATFKDYTTICNSAPSELLAELALRHRAALVQRNLGIVKDNLSLLNAFFVRHSELFNWSPPKAGPTAFPSLRLNRDIEEFCADLVEQKGVLLLPSSYYDYGNKNFRLGFARKNLPLALQKLDEYLELITVP